MRGVEMADNRAGHAVAIGDSNEKTLRELLQLHRSAVHQGDTDLSNSRDSGDGGCLVHV